MQRYGVICTATPRHPGRPIMSHARAGRCATGVRMLSVSGRIFCESLPFPVELHARVGEGAIFAEQSTSTSSVLSWRLCYGRRQEPLRTGPGA